MDSNLLRAAANGEIEPFEKKRQQLEQIVDESNNTILHIHIKSSETPKSEFVKTILDECPLLRLQVNAKGNTPLHFAAKYGHSAIAEILLQCKPRDVKAKKDMLEAKNNNGKTAFDKAVKNDKTEVVKKMIEEADPYFLDFEDNFHKILKFAANKGEYELLAAVAKLRHRELAREDPNGRKALLAILGEQPKVFILHIHIRSSKKPSTEFVKKLLDICPSLLLQVNDEEDTPFHVAAKVGEFKIVKVLLKHARDQPQGPSSDERADQTMLKMKKKDGKTILDEALENDKLKVVKTLIEEAGPHFFDFDNNIMRKILNLAARRGDVDVFDLVAKGPKGKAAMHEVLSSEISGTQPKDTVLHIHIKFLNARSYIHRYLKGNFTRYIFIRSRTTFAGKLLELCPQILLQVNEEGDTPLHTAAKSGFPLIVEIIVKCAKRPSEELSDLERVECMKMLKKENKYGKTALDIAAEEGKIEVLKVLIGVADPDNLAKSIGQILKLAAEKGNCRIVDLVAKVDEGKTYMRNALRQSGIPGLQSNTLLHFHIGSSSPSAEFVEKILGICPELLREADGKRDTPLHVAAKCDKSAIAEALLKHAGAQHHKEPEIGERADSWDILTETNEAGNTALDEAAKCEKIKVLKILIREAAGLEPSYFDKNIGKILYLAAKEEDQELSVSVSKLRMTDVLLQAVTRDSVYPATESGDTIMHYHIKSSKSPKSTEFMRNMLDLCPLLLVKINKKNDTPLHVAAKCGNSAIAEGLLKHAKDKLDQDQQSKLKDYLQTLTDSTEKRVDWQMLRVTNREGNTALHEAVGYGKTEVVEILTKEADPCFPYFANKANETPLYLAAERGDYKMVVAILGNCNSPAHEGPNRMTALHAAAMNTNPSAAREGSNETTALRVSEDSDSDDSGEPSLQIMREILRKKECRTAAQDKYGWTPVHYAAYYGLYDKVALLLKFDKEAASKPDRHHEMTALHMAASQGYKDIIEKIIVENEACCEKEDKRGWNVLHFAMLSLDKKELIDLLKNQKIKELKLIEKRDKNGNTPLHVYAAAYRDTILHFGNCQAVNSKNISVEHMLKQGYDHDLEDEIRELFVDVGEGQYQNGVIRARNGRDYIKTRDERRKKYYDGLKETRSSHLLVATLIATVTFTAAFAIPGGYKNDKGSDQGTAILNKNFAFQTFIIMDVIAMTLSLSSVFIHFIMSFENFQTYESLFTLASCLTMLAMGTVVVAFITGIYAVLEPSLWLAKTTCALGLSFFLLVLCSLILIYWRKFLNRPLRWIWNLLPHSKKES